jgi:hypothetical protein
MNNCPGRELGHRSPRLRRARVVVVITATVGLALLAAACSSSPSSTGSAISPSGGGSANSPSAVGAGSGSSSDGGSGSSSAQIAYSQCVRSHGIPNFPDPSSSGQIPKETAQQLGVSNSQLDAAQSACQHLLPGKSLSGQTSQTITTQQQQDYLNLASCMRSHGITSFPDPTFRGGSVEFPMLQHLVDIQSTQFMQAYHTCQKLIPSGLPYSGSGG